jgi:hypothetical protein
MKEVTVNGVTFAVSEQMAAAITAEQESVAVQVGDLRKGLEAANRPAAPVEPAGVSPADTTQLGTYNWDTGLFENPSEAVQKIVDIAVERAEEKMTQKYVQAENARDASNKFWDGFWQKNDHLADKKDVVDFIVARDQDLASMGLDQAAAQIRERTEAFLKNAGVNIPSGGKPPIVEGGPEKAPKTDVPAAAPAERGSSLGDVLRKRQKERAEGRHGNMKVVK